ncbi:hypothetical protein BH24CHL3_BH24CHL3_03150 [soil metagenome]
MSQAGSIVTFGSHVRNLRIAVGLTQEALADKSGLSPNAISAIERGKRRNPYPHTVLALAEALELEPADQSALIALASRRTGPGLADEAARAALPVPVAPLTGRVTEVTEAVALLRRPGMRMLTMTGPSGGRPDSGGSGTAPTRHRRSPPGSVRAVGGMARIRA